MQTHTEVRHFDTCASSTAMQYCRQFEVHGCQVSKPNIHQHHMKTHTAAMIPYIPAMQPAAVLANHQDNEGDSNAAARKWFTMQR